MTLLSNINFYFDCKTRLCLIVPGRDGMGPFNNENIKANICYLCVINPSPVIKNHTVLQELLKQLELFCKKHILKYAYLNKQ